MPKKCPKINPGYRGSETCITFEAVNAAFLSARARVGLKPVNNGKFKADEVGALGTVIHEASRFLAKQYGLTKDAVANGLPLIDTTRTAIEPYCPPFLMTPECEVARYRSITGACNNLENPHWGAAMNGHERFINPDYADGISAPRANSQVVCSLRPYVDELQKLIASLDSETTKFQDIFIFLALGSQSLAGFFDHFYG